MPPTKTSGTDTARAVSVSLNLPPELSSESPSSDGEEGFTASLGDSVGYELVGDSVGYELVGDMVGDSVG